ncbi:hypothetical protein [Helicobacter bilis]|nr:hypothetical protein [Helicobacter bilis]
MRLYILFLMLFYLCYAKDSKNELSESERKNAIVCSLCELAFRIL